MDFAIYIVLFCITSSFPHPTHYRLKHASE